MSDEDGNLTIPKDSVLYTLENCVHCANFLDKVGDLLESGYLKRAHCNPSGSKEEQEVCETTDKLLEFEGYPSIYSKEGKKVL